MDLLPVVLFVHLVALNICRSSAGSEEGETEEEGEEATMPGKLSLEDRISVLERRVDSLEAPSWRITDRGVDSWDSCGEAGPCDCAYLRRAVNCWEKLGGRGISPELQVPRDVQMIDISKNDLPSLPSSLLLGMDRLVEFSAYDVGLQSLPNHIFRSVWKLLHLKLGSNELKVLPGEIFSSLPQLQTLDLSQNSLLFLPRRLFSSNLALRRLDLSHNRLRALPEGFLVVHRNLTDLDLSHNSVEKLEGALSGLDSLERLAVDRNGLTDLDWLGPGCCRNLVELSAEGNSILSLTDELARLTKLERINLAHNNIKELSPSSLPPSVSRLDLSRNDITSIAASPVVLPRLARLKMAGNLLESLSASRHLYFCPALTLLDLSNNALGEATDLEGLPRTLKKMLFEGNLLDTLAPLDLARLSELKRLTLGDNMWECECGGELEAFVRSVAAGPPKLQMSLQQALCFSPEDMEGKALKELLQKCR